MTLKTLNLSVSSFNGSQTRTHLFFCVMQNDYAAWIASISLCSWNDMCSYVEFVTWYKYTIVQICLPDKQSNISDMDLPNGYPLMRIPGTYGG